MFYKMKVLFSLEYLMYIYDCGKTNKQTVEKQNKTLIIFVESILSYTFQQQIVLQKYYITTFTRKKILLNI